jgi:peptidyl-tRNA hydrolase, PTH1 family
VAGEEALLVKPATFMNRSGVAVERVLAARAADAADLVVVLDDAALDLGTLRVRERGSHGGHNGLRSLIEMLDSDEFARVRVGIRKGEPEGDLAEYVLSEFPEEDVLVVQEMVGLAGDAVECLVREGAGEAMNRFNGARKEPG